MFAKVKPNTQFIGQNIIYFNQVDSTNTFAIELMRQKMASDGTVVMAEFQGKGRGQSNNTWISEAFENLLFSIVIQPVTNFHTDPFSINKALAVSTYSVLKSFLPTKEVHIKWPNDLLIDRRKISGILVENNFTGNKLNWCIAGIGFNVNQKFEHFDHIHATSLCEKLENPIDRDIVLKAILEQFEKNYILLQSGHGDTISRQFDEALLGYQKPSKFKTQDGIIEANIMGCDNDGRLLLKHNDGGVQAHLHGTIKQDIHA